MFNLVLTSSARINTGHTESSDAKGRVGGKWGNFQLASHKLPCGMVKSPNPPSNTTVPHSILKQ